MNLPTTYTRHNPAPPVSLSGSSTPPPNGLRDTFDAAVIVRSVRGKERLVLAAAGVGLVLGALVTWLLPTSYESYAVVRFEAAVVDQLTQAGLPTSLQEDGLELEAKSDEVLRRAGSTLSPTMTPSELRPLIDASQVGNEPVLELVATTGNAERSAQIVNAVAHSMLIGRSEQINSEFGVVSTTLAADILAIEADLADLEHAIAADVDPALVIARDSVAEQLSVLTDIRARASQDPTVPTDDDLAGDIAALQAELADLDGQISDATKPELAIRRTSLTEQLNLLNALQVRADLYVAEAGEVLRAGLVPEGSAGTSPFTNGLAMALVGAGAMVAFLTFRRRAMVTDGETARLVGVPPIATFDRRTLVASPTEPVGYEEERTLDSLHRLALELSLSAVRRVVFISVGGEKVAGEILRRLDGLSHGASGLDIIDLEEDVFGADPDVPADRPRRLHHSHDIATTDDPTKRTLIVSPSPERSTFALELALGADAVILVVDTSTTSFAAVHRTVELLASVGVQPSGSLIVGDR